MTLPDVVETARAMLLLGTLLAILVVAGAVADILDRFHPLDDDDSAEDTL